MSTSDDDNGSGSDMDISDCFESDDGGARWQATLGGNPSDASSNEEEDEMDTGKGSSGLVRPPSKKAKVVKDPTLAKHCVNWGSPGDEARRDRPPFVLQTGIQSRKTSIKPSADPQPIDFFGATFTPDMKKLVVQSSNDYVMEMVTRPRPPEFPARREWPPKWARSWVARNAELTVVEFDVFLGLLLLKGCTHKGAEKDFWSTDPKRVRPVVLQMMTRNRFMDIKRALHCQAKNAEPSGESGLPKVGHLFDMFLATARQLYVPDREMALDEMMLKVKGKSKYKRTHQQKPIREGFKIYVVRESGTGYVFEAVFDKRKHRLGRKTVDVSQAYNASKGAVDQADQTQAYITARLRAFKWWHPVFYWILDNACVNAFVLWKDQFGDGMKMHRFIDNVTDGLFESRLKMVESSQDEEVVKAKEAEGKQKGVHVQKKKGGLGHGRLIGKHFPIFTPSVRKRCVLCCHTHGSGSKKADCKASYYCELCEKHLHLECFAPFHTLADPKSAF